MSDVTLTRRYTTVPGITSAPRQFARCHVTSFLMGIRPERNGDSGSDSVEMARRGTCIPWKVWILESKKIGAGVKDS